MPENVHRFAPRHLVCGFASPYQIMQQGTLRLTKGRGIYVWDQHGRRYIDGLASLWNVAVGHGQPSIPRAVARQMHQIAYAPTLLGFSSHPAEELARRIVKLAPRGLTRVLFTSGGSEANESVIRLVRLYWRLKGHPEKYRIVTLNRGYHGSSTGAASLTGLPYFHQYYEPLLDGVLRLPRPHCGQCDLDLQYPSCQLACAEELEQLIRREGAHTIGAVLVEPVQGVGGVIVPPDGYHQRLREICSRYDILFACDEVITGFGRLGYPFGIQRWRVAPDLISFAKGVTSGYLPLGGVLLREEIYRTLVEAGPDFSLHHGFTYSGHPAVCAAALANLNLMRRRRLMSRARRLESYFARLLDRLRRWDVVKDIRVIGLMAAVECNSASAAGSGQWPFAIRLRQACLERGLILRASGDSVVLCPPLVVKASELRQIVELLDQALEAVATGGNGADRETQRANG
ncbi:MAG: aspartate aminotransferase family protein [Candidatus Binatia bacterium]|nr:MAG: aspartate aminotransferase family protein [Candidatus Binatia bacterium]